MDLFLKEKLENMSDEMVWEHLTFGEMIECWKTKYGERIAVSDGNKSLSYRDLDELSSDYAQGLLDLGINRDEKVILQLPNCIEFIIASFALFKVGAIPVMVLPAHRKSEVKGIMEITKAVAYIGKDKYLGFSYVNMIREIIEESSQSLNVIIVGNSEEFLEFNSLNRKKCKVTVGKGENDYKKMGLLLLSGGTTGTPKLIPRRHCDYLYVAKELGKKCHLSGETVYLAALPMSHNFPLGCPGIIGTFMYGGRVELCDFASPDEIISAIEERNVTITGLVPTMANLCVDFLMVSNSDISSLEVIQVGGSVLDSLSAERIEKAFGCKLQQIFGIAEGLICCTDLNDTEEIIYNSQGKPISDKDEVLIVDEKGEEVANEEYGELICRGPYTIYGYYNAEEVNKKCINDKCYFMTGDKAKKLGNGNYKIVGRIKEMINRAGEKILPSELEKILIEHEYISDVQVVGVPDKILGEKIAVFLVDNKKIITLKDLKEFLKEKGVADFKLPDLVKYVDSWPLTSVGKIDRNKLKELVNIKIGGAENE